MPTLQDLITDAELQRRRQAATHRPLSPADTRSLASLGLVGAAMVPGAGVADAAGYFPTADGGFAPSLPANLRAGNFLDAGLQGLGVAGDALTAFGPAGAALGATMKAPRLSSLVKKASKAENEAAGLYHPIGGGLKLERPVQAMTATREPVKNLPPRTIVSPEAMQGGVLVPAVGDRTAAAVRLTEINGRALNAPVMLEGGADFMRTHLPDGAAWASGKGVVTRLSDLVRQAGEEGKNPVYMPYVAMGHTAGDFSTMMSDALLAQIDRSKLTKKAVRELDKQVRGLRPDFVGLDSPELQAQLRASGPTRLALVDRMSQKEMRDLKFPDVASTRYAITEPGLMDAPLHGAGFAIAKMDPQGRVIPNPRNPHTTYDTQLAGQYIGGLEANVPREVMFPEFFQQRRARGSPVEGDTRAFALSNVTQRADQQWLDGVMRYLEQARQQGR